MKGEYDRGISAVTVLSSISALYFGIFLITGGGGGGGRNLTKVGVDSKILK